MKTAPSYPNADGKPSERADHRENIGDCRGQSSLAPAAGSPASVVHQQWPPTTGSQRCVRCTGWIIVSQSFWIGHEGPICPHCFSQPGNM